MKGIILIIIAVLVAVSFISMRNTSPDEQPQIFPEGLKVEDLIAGTGDEAVSGAIITAHYLGTLEDGTKFDSSYDRGEPFQFQLGVGQVIEGWDLGVIGMKVGGKRKLTISPDLGYGSSGAGDLIPPDATLLFEIELVGVEHNNIGQEK